jgi:cell division protein ZapA (FtsZ GTPase activity inhibitor)|tara:strand:- start:4609 stop:4989 length:381 start_codon:yes stop_codon:yes gene_type:complete
MSKSQNQVQGVAVKIFEDEYLIADADAQKVERIAQYVDKKMREIDKQHSANISTSKLAVLAAMTIADEFMQAVGEQSRLAETAQENLHRLSALVDARVGMANSAAIDEGVQRSRWRDESKKNAVRD